MPVGCSALRHGKGAARAPITMKVAVIEVKRTGEGDPLELAVIVRVGDGETRHHVTMVRDTCERLTAGTHTPERCIEAAFEFLLDREPKESILRRFDVTVISRYFAARLSTKPLPTGSARFPKMMGTARVCWSSAAVVGALVERIRSGCSATSSFADRSICCGSEVAQRYSR